MSAPTHEQVLSKWRGFADYYAQHYEGMTIQPARTLYQLLGLSDPQVSTVLEVACGAGTCSREIAMKINPNTRFAAIDFTPEMVSKTTAALSSLDTVSSQPFSSHLSVSEGNGEDLVHIPSNFVDRYLSNLCLMLVPDHKAMIRETYRVLREGGVAAFTVWGNKNQASFFTTMPTAMAKFGLVQEESVRSNFHLGQDDEALRQEFLDAGFSAVSVWHQFAVFESLDSSRILETLYDVPSFKSMFSQACESTALKIREEVKRLFDQELASGRPIGFDTILIMVRK